MNDTMEVEFDKGGGSVANASKLSEQEWSLNGYADEAITPVEITNGNQQVDEASMYENVEDAKPPGFRPSHLYLGIAMCLGVIALFLSLNFTVWDDIQMPSVSEDNGPILCGNKCSWYPMGYDINGDKPQAEFGSTIFLSRSGKKLAVGVPKASEGKGLVRVYRRVGDYNDWIKPNNDLRGEADEMFFGYSVALANEGNIMAISSNKYVRVLTERNNKWVDFGANYIPVVGAKNTVEISNGGRIVAVTSESEPNSKIYIYKLNNDGNQATWDPYGDVLNNGGEQSDHTTLISLSDEGKRIAFTSGSSNVINVWDCPLCVDDDEPEEVPGKWEELKNSVITANAEISSIVLSDNGKRLAYSMCETNVEQGYVIVYEYTDDGWKQLGKNLSGENLGDRFGCTGLAFSSKGRHIAVGAPTRDGPATVNIGFTYVYQFGITGDDLTEKPNWHLLGKAPISGEQTGDNSGAAVSLADDGSVVAVGAPFNSNENGSNTGHVRVYKFR